MQDRLRSIAGEVVRAEAEAKQRGACDAEDSSGQGQKLELPAPDPWPEAVELADVLAEAEAAIRRYVWLTEQQAVAAALWAAWTHCVDVFDVAPILLVTSPVKRCGKTTLGRVLTPMLPRVLAAANITPAALFRTIEQARPTLVVDEADAFLTHNEELRGLLDAGHTRDSAYVIRVVGEDLEPRRFGVFGAKLLLGIGQLAGTIEDRAIILRLERKPPGAAVQRLTRACLAGLHDLGRKFARWLVDHRGDLDPDADPPIPEALHDRQADCWRPLLALADLAGGDWPARARGAAMALASSATAEDELAIRLLRDLRTVFDSMGRSEVSASILIEQLCNIEEAPWATLSRGKPITPHRLAKMLNAFGVHSQKTAAARVYSRQSLARAWDRYCSPLDG